METVFDHNITHKEALSLFAMDISKEQYLSFLETCTDKEEERISYSDLYYLYLNRQEKDKAIYFANKIKDKNYVLLELTNHDYKYSITSQE